MKKTQRVSAIIKILSDYPNKLYPLKYFCSIFDAAKSSISEDIMVARELLLESGLGTIETVSGAAGGVKYVPYISDEDCLSLQQEICEKLRDGSRILGGGFLYTSDIMFDHAMMKRIATVFARRFQNADADYVATIETKGLPVAFMTAHMLNLPMVVVRRESKVSEGSTVSINYFSGSSDRIQKMSVAKRALTPGSKALIIDDFMRAGGSLKGISDILTEFDITVVGTGVIIVSTEPEKKKISDFFPLVYLGDVDETGKKIELFPNRQIF